MEKSQLTEDMGKIKINPKCLDVLLPPHTPHRIAFGHLKKKKSSTSPLQKSLSQVDAKNSLSFPCLSAKTLPYAISNTIQGEYYAPKTTFLLAYQHQS